MSTDLVLLHEDEATRRSATDGPQLSWHRVVETSAAGDLAALGARVARVARALGRGCAELRPVAA